MMGTKARIFAPIAVISLDDLVPINHFYRHLDHVLDLSFVRDLVKETYAHGGRPSIDPVVFFKLQLVMFLKTSARSGCSCSWWQINSACAGMWDTIWMSRYPIIRA